MISKLVGLEITSERIRIVDIEKKGACAHLKNIASVQTPANTFADGYITDIDKVADAVRDLFVSSGITTKNVAISLSGKGVVIQEINIPNMPQSEMREVIKSELERYSVFLTDNFIFDYQPLSEVVEKGHKRVRVFFVGVSCRLLSSYFDCMQKSGLTIVSIDTAPLSMATSQYADLNKEKATALVLIKEDKTYVIVIKKGKFCLFYNIDIGTKQLFKAKLQTEEALDEEAASELIGELRRSFKFYEIEFTAGEVDRVILSHYNQKLSHLAKRIVSIFNKEIEIEVANPFKHIKIPDRLAAEKIGNESKEDFAVCVGAALKALMGAGHNLSLELLQKYIPQKGVLKKKQALVAGSCILIFLLSTGITGYHEAMHKRISASLQEKRLELAALDSRLEGLKDLAQRHNYLRERLKRQALYLKNLNRISWSVLLAKVTQQMPEDVWLKAFKSTDSGIFGLEGGAFSVDRVADFIRRLGQEPTFKNVGLDTLDQKQFSEKATGVDFKLESNLSTPKEKKDDAGKAQTKQ